MIVAIVKIGTGSGQTFIEEFREAAGTAQAVVAFVGEYNPPLNPADYLGHDTGFSNVPPGGIGKRWGYDFDAIPPAIIEIDADEDPDVVVIPVVQSELAIISPGPGWQVLGGFVGRIPKLIKPLTHVGIRIYGEYKATGSGTNNLRIVEVKGTNQSVLTPGTTRFNLIDTAGLFQTFQFDSSVAARTGNNTFTLQGNLNGGVSVASIRFASMVLVKKKVAL